MTIKKNTLSKISNDLRKLDFTKFNPATDKPILMIEIQKIKSKLGKLLRLFENETT